MSKTVVISDSKVKTDYNVNDTKLVSIRKGDLECRLWNIKDYPNNHNPEAELVKWDKVEGKDPTCYTCAIWDKDKEGWTMRSVGSRFFEVTDKNLMSLCNTFDYILNNLYSNEVLT